ncbi:TOMM precursor leader peptide-binding protein [Bradyrhizobium tunisiense]|uniref:TOMM precursor leader peptide-binding protein n=1 Tax=Bradyrhizobium tunisiense TaxID=3278709 RepID=UPI0035E014ED
MLLKRGRAIVNIKGTRSKEIAQALLAVAAERDATRAELCEPFPEEIRPAIAELIDALESRRFLTEGGPDEPSRPEAPIDVFFWHFGKRTADISRAFERAQVTIVGVNKVSRQIAQALAESGVGSLDVVDYPLLNNVRMFDEHGEIEPSQWPVSLAKPRPYREWFDMTHGRDAGCLVVTSDFGGQHLLRSWNRHCVCERIPFLPVVLQDLIGRIGPLVMPGEGPCLECLRARENANIDDPDLQRAVEQAAFEGQVVTAFHPSMASVLGDIAAMELLKLYGQFMRSRLVGRMIEINLVAPDLVERRVLKMPHCSVCGTDHGRTPVSLNKVAFMPGHEVAR